MFWPFFDFNVVFGSVIINSTKSWYMGPVSGAISAINASPVMMLLNQANPINDNIYVAQILNRFTFEIVTSPTIQIINMAHMLLPHWILRMAMLSDAINSIMTTPKFVGFQI